MKNAKLLLGMVSLLYVTTSCNKDNEDTTTQPIVKISAKTTYTGSIGTGKATNAIALNSFLVNLKEIKFKYENEQEDNHSGDNDHDGFFDADDNFKLRGPFELNLLNGPVDFVATNIPQEVYKEVEFKLAKSTNTNSTIYNKSVEIKGTIDTTPFVFWHDLQEEFEVDYANATNNIIVGQNLVTVVFNFNLDAVLATVDLSTAQDGNGDGTIEISPTDPDGNQALAELIKNKIKEHTEIEDHEGHDD